MNQYTYGTILSMALVLVGCDGAGSAKPNASAAVSPE